MMKMKFLASYLRLSRLDASIHTSEKQESNSISNQRLLIKSFLFLHPELLEMPYQEYVDDGYTGTNTKRPAFQRLLSDVRSGKTGVIIVKDMSRFSREFIVLGDYVEQIFPLFGVRFISINDNYDSMTSLSSSTETMNVAIQSLVYDYYSKDLSKKRASSVRSRMQNGKFLGPAPYGYVSNYRDHQYEIDPEAAQIVKVIFTMAAQGIRPTAIGNYLNEQKVPTPARYNQEHPELHKTGGYYKTSQPLWSYHTVQRILKDPVYCGILELGKSYHSQPHRTGQTDRTVIRIENAHDPIITQELFDAACEAQKRPPGNNRKKKIPVLETPLVGFLTCGYCGLSLRFHAFSKTAYCIQSRMSEAVCPKERYPLNDLDAYILAEIKTVLHKLIEERKHWEWKMEMAKKQQNLSAQKIALLKKTGERLLEEKRLLFETYANGALPENVFLKQKQDLSSQADQNKQDLSILQRQETILSNLEIPPDLIQLSEAAQSHLKAATLTKELLRTYIDTVLVYGINDYQIRWRKSILSCISNKGDLS